MNKSLIISYFALSLVLANCDSPEQVEVFDYNRLPKDVRKAFNDIYNQIPNESELPRFIECIDLNEQCDCRTSKGSSIFGQAVKIQSCDNRFVIPFDYLDRVFIIYGDNLYMPQLVRAKKMRQ